MTKPRPTGIRAGESDALRATADLILGRASAIAAPPAKDRALELARLILREAPGFGGREMRDAEILTTLKAEQIGPATFRKALSIARKELAKRPRAPSSKRARPPADKQGTAGAAAVPKAPPKATPESSIAATLDRKLL